MNLTNIQYTKIRKQINNEYLDAKVECLQQSPMVDNDSSNFFEPMADYLALLIIKKWKQWGCKNATSKNLNIYYYFERKIQMKDVSLDLTKYKLPIHESYIPAVGYCRFSSDMQTENSIEAQKRAITIFAEINGYVIKEWYIDRAFSGKTDKRPDFQRLINDVCSKDRDFSVVIIHKLDRFSRKTEHSIKYKDLFEDYGVKLVSVAEKIENDPNGIFMFIVKSAVNQYYSLNLGTEVTKGLLEAARNKKWTGGTPPLGYDVINQELKINETEAIIVRKIFQMCADGYGYGTIINELNRCGYLTKAGNKFGKNSIYDILKNEKYKGVYTYNKRAKRNSENKRNSHKYKEESEIIRFEDGVPAIVSKELWEKANFSRKMASKVSTNAKNEYLLTGLLYCGECGAKLHGNHRLYKERGYNTYRCNKRTNQNICKFKEIRADILEDFVISNLLTHFSSPEIIDKITNETNRKIHEMMNAENEDVTNAKNSLKGLKVAQNNLVDAISMEGYSKVISDRLNNIENQIKEYETLIEKAESNKKEITITPKEIKDKISHLKKDILNNDDVTKAKLLLRSYIEKIVIDNYTVKVIYKVATTVNIDESNCEVYYNHAFSEYRNQLKSVW